MINRTPGRAAAAVAAAAPGRTAVRSSGRRGSTDEPVWGAIWLYGTDAAFLTKAASLHDSLGTEPQTSIGSRARTLAGRGTARDPITPEGSA